MSIDIELRELGVSQRTIDAAVADETDKERQQKASWLYDLFISEQKIESEANNEGTIQCN